MCKGTVLLIVALLLTLDAAVYAPPAPGPGGGGGQNWFNQQQQQNQQAQQQGTVCYVLVVYSDKYAATCYTMQTYDAINQKIDETKKTNTEYLQFNQDLVKQVGKLEADLKAKKAEASKTPSDELKRQSSNWSSR
jgi:hypothetical protein